MLAGDDPGQHHLPEYVVPARADPKCSISRDPRREDHTTCTAVAPDLVLTVRTYGTEPLYGPRRVRNFCSYELQTSRSAWRAAHEPAIVSQLRE